MILQSLTSEELVKYADGLLHPTDLEKELANLLHDAAIDLINHEEAQDEIEELADKLENNSHKVDSFDECIKEFDDVLDREFDLDNRGGLLDRLDGLAEKTTGYQTQVSELEEEVYKLKLQLSCYEDEARQEEEIAMSANLHHSGGC